MKKKVYKFEVKCDPNKMKWHHAHKQCGGIYGLGFIGAAIYFISKAVGFWGVILAILKAIVWPAFLVYALLKSLGV